MGKARTQEAITHVTLDAGALIALERGSRRMVALLALALERHVQFHVPAAVLGQVWRNPNRQASVARLLRQQGVDVCPLDEDVAKACGVLCGAAGTRDVIDASVVVTARQYGGVVVTSDADDLLQLDPRLAVERV